MSYNPVPSVVGRTVPSPYGRGTWTIEALSIEPNLVDGTPCIVAKIRWEGTGSTVLDGGCTLGTLAPGTPLWDALSAS